MLGIIPPKIREFYSLIASLMTNASLLNSVQPDTFMCKFVRLYFHASFNEDHFVFSNASPYLPQDLFVQIVKE